MIDVANGRSVTIVSSSARTRGLSSIESIVSSSLSRRAAIRSYASSEDTMDRRVTYALFALFVVMYVLYQTR